MTDMIAAFTVALALEAGVIHFSMNGPEWAALACTVPLPVIIFWLFNGGKWR